MTALVQSRDGVAPQAIHPLIDTVRELTAVMHDEIDLLRAMQVREFGKLQDRKLALVSTYEQQSAVLRQDPVFAASMDPRLRAELKDVVSRMHTVMKDNESAIKAARAANERLAHAILEAVQSQKPKNQGYAADGAQHRDKAVPPVSLKVDQHL